MAGITLTEKDVEELWRINPLAEAQANTIGKKLLSLAKANI